jgi:hypothetical protein
MAGPNVMLKSRIVRFRPYGTFHESKTIRPKVKKYVAPNNNLFEILIFDDTRKTTKARIEIN